MILFNKSSKGNLGVAGDGDFFLNPKWEGNYEHGLEFETNNYFEDLIVSQGINISKSMRLRKIIVIVYSMIIIKKVCNIVSSLNSIISQPFLKIQGKAKKFKCIKFYQTLRT